MDNSIIGDLINNDYLIYSKLYNIPKKSFSQQCFHMMINLKCIIFANNLRLVLTHLTIVVFQLFLF